jgi:RHS repeat-associated protein
LAEPQGVGAGQLRTLVTKNGSDTTTESHDVTYLDAGIYINGNRVTDHYVLTRADTATGATTCLASAPCDAKYVYDARDKLTSHQLRAGRTDTYTLDEPGKLLGDTSIRAGNVTTEVKNGVTTTKKYRSTQLTEITTGGVTGKYWYDDFGNVDCLTLAAGTQADCSPSDAASPSANLITDYAFDYLQRLQSMSQYAGGTRTDRTIYTSDALDRVSTEVENHTGTGNDRTTAFTYQGMSGLSTEEKQTGGTNPRTKTFSYDAYGHRLAMTDTATGSTAEPDQYTFSHDVHSSVSQLINDTGQVKASYGYDAYGGADAPSSDPQALTTGDTNNLAPTNPYRYTSRRMDSGTASSNSTPSPVPNGSAGYDMGARRYGPDTGAFLQQDMYAGALSNLGLSLDPLTQNRYALAGGNPISYIETDGHNALSDWLSDAGDAISEKWNDFQNAIGEGPNGFEDSPTWLRVPLQTWDDLDNASFTSIGTSEADRKASTDRLANSTFGEFTGITDAKKCDDSANKLNGACATSVLNIATVFVGGPAAKAGVSGARGGRATELLNGLCSFSAATRVLMADGTTKPISEVEIGDMVLATDPETGEQGPREVTHLWVHDDQFVELDVDGATITTTEDHPYWNDTDKQWERADQLDPGDTLLTANGKHLRVHGIRAHLTHTATAYNLTVDGIHTYYVVAGTAPVLVHNTCISPAIKRLAESHITSSGDTVLGHLSPNNYIDKAKRLGASYFDIGAVWNTLTETQRWHANSHFLDIIAARGDRVLLSVPSYSMKRPSYLEREVDYLVNEKGYQWVNQWALKPGA